jgi:hypothetical protein
MLKAGGGAFGAAAAGLAAPPRVAATAIAPPATAAATKIHFLRPAAVCNTAAGALLVGSATYWKETVPARACSLEAKIRI